MTFTTDVPPAPATGYFQQLGFTNVTQSAIIAANIRGLGLPKFLWFQMVNLLQQADATAQADMTCT